MTTSSALDRGAIPPTRAVPRLPDCDDEHCTCPPFETLPPETQAWQYVLMWLPVGWAMAPPRLLPATDAWLAVAYNVRGCLKAFSYVTWTHRRRLAAVSLLGVYFEGDTDEMCARARHRRRN